MTSAGGQKRKRLILEAAEMGSTQQNQSGQGNGKSGKELGGGECTWKPLQAVRMI